jgi:hypothetical protein
MMKDQYNAKAEMLLNLVIKNVPGRTVAHRNLADLFLKKGENEKALKHYYVAQKQQEVFNPKKKSILPHKIREALKIPPMFSEEERQNWLGFEQIKINGIEYVNFYRPPLVPLKYTIRRSGDEGVHLEGYDKSFSITEKVAVQGVPLDPEARIEFESVNMKLNAGVLDQDFKISNVLCARKFAFSKSENGVFNCTSAQDQMISGWLIQSGTDIYLDEFGKPFEFTLAKDSEISGYWMMAGRKVILNSSFRPGSLVMFSLAKDFSIQDVFLPSGTEVSFNPGLKNIPKPSDLIGQHLKIRPKGIAKVGKWKLINSIDLAPGFKFKGGYLSEDWNGPDGRFCAKGNYLGNFEAVNPREILCHNPLH